MAMHVLKVKKMLGHPRIIPGVESVRLLSYLAFRVTSLGVVHPILCFIGCVV